MKSSFMLTKSEEIIILNRVLMHNLINTNINNIMQTNNKTCMMCSYMSCCMVKVVLMVDKKLSYTPNVLC